MPNDFKPGEGYRQQEAILRGMLAKNAAVCPECRATTKLWKLAKHPDCTGQVCSCGWEGSPEYQLMPNGSVSQIGAFVPGDVR